MAEGNALSTRQSLYSRTAIQQVSNDDRDGVRSPQSPDLPVPGTFGQEFHLICGICLQDLKRPRQLRSCCHIFCTDCLNSVVLVTVRDGKVRCPLPKCRVLCDEKEVSREVSSDTYLHAGRGLISVYAESGSVNCSEATHDPARPEPAAHFCMECGKNYCSGCYVDHSGNEDFLNHHCLRLFKTSATMTVGVNRGRRRAESEEEEVKYNCPVCRNTDMCEHESWLSDLEKEEFRKGDRCQIPTHAPGNELIVYCTECEEAICTTCSMIEHKLHKTSDMFNAVKDKKMELQCIKKNLVFHQEIFANAAQSADKAEEAFVEHIGLVEREMVERKGAVQISVEEAFEAAFATIDQTGQKQAELNKQSGEMHEEEQFFNTAIQLAELALEGDVTDIEFMRIWKGLDFIWRGMKGEDTKAKVSQVVTTQTFVEKKLVLPTTACMNPDLSILRKVGVESTVLRLSFKLKAQDELLLFYSILPLTETEALVSCKPQACTASMVQYSNITSDQRSVQVKDGQYSIIAVPGNGIVATLYQSPHACGGGGEEKRQVLFWDQALDKSITQLEAKEVGDKLKVLSPDTELPPRGVAVTRDNHLVVCTAEDPPKGEGEGAGKKCRILIMTMRGDVLHRRDVGFSAAGPSPVPYFPQYVTVNINGDICVTDGKDRSVTVYNSRLFKKLRIINVYDKDSLNNNFCPLGICHDSFGRLIVADADNHSVIRIKYDNTQNSWTKVILKEGQDGVTDLTNPKLVALGQGPKLWVVCQTNIQVFDYMDSE